MSNWDKSADFVIVGSGGGSFCAALAAQDRGLSTLIVEKTDKVGGSTAMSGGVLWIPNNPLMKERGLEDSYEKAREYFDASVGPEQPGSNRVRRDAYLRTGPEMIKYLQHKGLKLFLARWWPDYYANLPGGEPVSRSLLAEMFDLKALGAWMPRLRTYPGFDMPLHSDDFPDLMRVKTTGAGKRAAMKLVGRMVKDIVLRRKTRGQGAALQGRLLQIAVRNKVPIWTNAGVKDLVIEDGRIAGVVVQRGGETLRVKAERGVLLNVGGFARNDALRQKYQRHPITNHWTSANPGDTGDMLEVVRGLGAATHNLDSSIWVLTTRMPDGGPAPGQILPDGLDLPYIHVVDIGKPHGILVNQSGQRFCNESGSYMEMGERMYASGSVPAWMITDQTHRDRYPWGRANPGQTPDDWLKSGFLKRADTIEELAKLCGIDAAGLKQTVERFNGYCANGADPEFQRGSDAYGQWVGDPCVKPNPALGPLIKAPFYAMAVFPGDVGTYGGFVCDEDARVLREDGTAIEGLYATGNCTAGVTGRVYPGAGASIGASFVFGYRAAHHASGHSLPV
jgi:3-oxosteroid 1-dehydrogenase